MEHPFYFSRNSIKVASEPIYVIGPVQNKCASITTLSTPKRARIAVDT